MTHSRLSPRHTDLTQAYGPHGYRHAVEHYLTFGLHERRLGYLEGGYGGRWTVSDHQHRLFVSASRRMGAAIDSLVWDSHEFLNSWDHGRELQMAVSKWCCVRVLGEGDVDVM